MSNKMIINFSTSNHCLWHSDCDREKAPPMKEIQVEVDNEQTLLECTHCKKQGYYPHGGLGEIEVDVMVSGLIKLNT